MTIVKKGTIITSLCEWKTLAGPKKKNQWKEGRSAMEAARAWLEGKGKTLPPEVLSALGGHQAFGSIQSWQAEPEAKLRFDTFAGETRNSDLIVYAKDSHGSFLIAVEAKADEPFSETVSEIMTAALERYLKNNRSNAVTRVEQLTRAILGPREKKGEPSVGEIRYQLLTACAGALCEAERCSSSRALMLIHEFITNKTNDNKHLQNAEDLNKFVKRISHGVLSSVQDGKIYGPFVVPGTPILTTRVELFIGKVSRNRRSNDV